MYLSAFALCLRLFFSAVSCFAWAAGLESSSLLCRLAWVVWPRRRLIFAFLAPFHISIFWVMARCFLLGLGNIKNSASSWMVVWTIFERQYYGQKRGLLPRRISNKGSKCLDELRRPVLLLRNPSAVHTKFRQASRSTCAAAYICSFFSNRLFLLPLIFCTSVANFSVVIALVDCHSSLVFELWVAAMKS